MKRKRHGRRGLGRALFAVLVTSSLSACASLLPGAGPPPDIFTLTPKTTFSADLPTVQWQLVVEEPHASAALDTTRIALTKSLTQLDYFAKARWSARAPQLVQTMLVESFENTKRIVAVGREAINLRSDYNLRTDLREFQAEYLEAGRTPKVRVRLNAKIVRQPKREIIASQTFEEVVPATGSGIEQIVIAFDDALGKVLRHTVEWTLRSAP